MRSVLTGIESFFPHRSKCRCFYLRFYWAKMVQIKIFMEQIVWSERISWSQQLLFRHIVGNQQMLKKMKKNGKNDQNSNFHKVAGNEIGQLFFLWMWSPRPGEHSRYLYCFHTYPTSTSRSTKRPLMMNKNSKKNFFFKKF